MLLSGLTLGGVAACTYGGDEREILPPRERAPVGDPASYPIDADETVGASLPGRGTGLFVEYESGGTWRIWVSCDTELSSYVCRWDVIVASGGDAELSGVAEEDLEGGDWLDEYGARGLRLVADTDYDFDGFQFQAEASAPLQIDVELDGGWGHAFAYWVGDGELREGAESNPFELVPNGESDED